MPYVVDYQNLLAVYKEGILRQRRNRPEYYVLDSSNSCLERVAFLQGSIHIASAILNGTDLSDGISRKPVLLLRFDTIVVDLLLREIS